ncbi:hypothetical protein [Luteimicrobium subarcticum]|uniref:Ig-like domain-containing protein n=1 Tax=Luteimicrobium subarcticum TaxID=620910 RepID=A0A2M8W765_9MICO|nr:hypothetical protein [Luteimicrobium subarcticum]PJI86749.1 hypothetical protein CLV34_2672 [Luteimicrobium subarcticum]
MKISTRRVAALFSGAALVLAGSVLVAPTAQAATSCVTTANTSNYRTVACSTITSKSSTFVVADSDGVINSTGQTATLECSITKSATVSMSVSTTLEASVKAGILADFKASVGVSMSASVTTESSIKTSVSVPAHKTILCERGIVKYTLKGQTVYTTTNMATGSTSKSTKTWTIAGPTSKTWKLVQQ